MPLPRIDENPLKKMREGDSRVTSWVVAETYCVGDRRRWDRRRIMQIIFMIINYHYNINRHHINCNCNTRSNKNDTLKRNEEDYLSIEVRGKMMHDDDI